MGEDKGKLLTPIEDRGSKISEGLSHPYRCRGSTQMRPKPVIRPMDGGLLFLEYFQINVDGS